ncbi:MAG: tryptophan--tRNA ligase [Armatimonadetes bacterium]|nr:tryptophan--tRNA ligase [Armatimonadota bacterium]NIM23957.1 tryptophan--tRNA ligase [Armatimonadota bacterium]NIM67804.1 tryptophan--tRNA ligase [Armatimonadota bacterium]NIM76344.1 tryptophan--tRNA ligase [Armatimonadota bacterium]NIN06038.1 tryptophan--tRNA ligase [Armatimonadota bacterium]
MAKDKQSKQRIIFSGMKPTGRLHLGNLEGALRNWVSLQDEWKMYCGIVDLHALTTAYESPDELRGDIFDMAVNWMAAGLDPERTTFIIQSKVPAHAELHLLLSMLTPISWLERVPTYKEVREELHITSPSYGFLGYPVLQAADILIYLANAVPVGKDQAPHIELTREIARRFNHLYGDLFPEPDTLLNEVPVLPGIDGRKMSKSYGNTIYMSDEPEEIRQKVSQMFTDPQKIRRGDPGRPDTCPVFAYQAVYGPQDMEWARTGCESGDLGCVEHKRKLADQMVEAMEPIRQKRAELLRRPEQVWEILESGSKKAIEVTSQTLALVRKAMSL